MLLIVLMIAIVPVCATTSQEQAPPVDVIYYSNLTDLLSSIPEDAFGGVYINQDGQTVINIVRGSDFANIPRTIGRQAVTYAYVDCSLASLEAVHKALIPYMQQLGIVMLDANDQTNMLDVAVYTQSEELYAFLSKYIDLAYVNFIILSEDYTTSFSVSLEPLTNNVYAFCETSRAISTIYPGNQIRIGDSVYCTAGPRISSNSFYTCGHALKNFLNKN